MGNSFHPSSAALHPSNTIPSFKCCALPMMMLLAVCFLADFTYATNGKSDGMNHSERQSFPTSLAIPEDPVMRIIVYMFGIIAVVFNFATIIMARAEDNKPRWNKVE